MDLLFHQQMAHVLANASPWSTKVCSKSFNQPEPKKLSQAGRGSHIKSVFLHNWPCVWSLGWKILLSFEIQLKLLPIDCPWLCCSTPSSLPQLNIPHLKKKIWTDAGFNTGGLGVPALSCKVGSQTEIKRDPLWELALVWEIALTLCGVTWLWNYMCTVLPCKALCLSVRVCVH